MSGCLKHLYQHLMHRSFRRSLGSTSIGSAPSFQRQTSLGGYTRKIFDLAKGSDQPVATVSNWVQSGRAIAAVKSP